MEQSYVVWFCKDDGWTLSKEMTKAQAELYALNLKDRGYSIRIVPRLSVTLDDIING